MEKIKIHRFGSILKQENIWCLDKVGLPDTCVLESLSPFPGYYGDDIKDAKPRFVYFVLKSHHSLEEITRSAMKIRKILDFNFDVALAQITMNGQTCHAVRISNVEEYSKIRLVQEQFKDHGIVFHKRSRKIEDEPGLIKIKKFFDLEYYPEAQVYLNLEVPSLGYFALESKLEWEEFRAVIKALRNNWSGPKFDAALGFFYQENAIVDVVRIYAETNQLEFMTCIKQVFHSKLSKI